MSLLEHFTFCSHGSSSLSSSSNGASKAIKPLQTGGFGQVYLAMANTSTYSTCCKYHSCFGLKQGQYYAIKFFNKRRNFLKKDIITVSNQISGLCKVYFYETMSKDEERYIRNLLKISNDISLSDYCIMEFVDGFDIHDLLIKGQRFSKSEIKNMAKQVLTTLSKLHQKGYSHRDIKLENVIYNTSTEEYVLIDLDTLTNKAYTEDQVGTDCYLSPDIRDAYVNKQAVSAHMWQCADRYALAIMIYELYHFGNKVDNDKVLSMSDVPDFRVSVPSEIRNLYWALITKTSEETSHFLSYLS